MALLAGGCAFADSHLDRHDQVAPAGPCWEVNLGDGLDTADTAELHALFACLDQSGDLAPLAVLDAALDAEDRDGVPVGLTLAALYNGLDVPSAALADLAALIRDGTAATLAEIGVEALYGRAYPTVAAGGVELRAGSELDRGLVRPALPLARDAATVLLDEPEVAPLLGEALAGEAARSLVCAAAGLAEADDPEVSGLADRLLPELGEAVAATAEADNDRWSGASGDSLRDAAEALLLDTAGDGATPLEAMRGDLAPLLADAALGEAVEAVLAEARADGRVEPLPLQLLALAGEDPEGGALEDGEDSALAALVRLVAEADAPLDCSFDLWVTDFEVHLDNLAVAILAVLAEQDPERVQGGVDVLGTVLGWSLSRSTLEAVADSGVCPVLDGQLVADLQALDRLSDPETRDLVIVGIGLLDALHAGGETDHLGELAGLLHTAWARGLVPPAEELLRDLADTALAGDLDGWLGLLLDPEPIRAVPCAESTEPPSLSLLQAAAATAVGDGEDSPVAVLEPLTALLVARDESWTVLHNGAELAQQDEARVQGLWELLARAVDEDPDLGALDRIADLLADPDRLGPPLRVVETPAVPEALGQAELAEEGPLPFAARLVVGGTLSTLLDTLALVLDWLEGLRP